MAPGRRSQTVFTQSSIKLLDIQPEPRHRAATEECCENEPQALMQNACTWQPDIGTWRAIMPLAWPGLLQSNHGT